MSKKEKNHNFLSSHAIVAFLKWKQNQYSEPQQKNRNKESILVSWQKGLAKNPKKRHHIIIKGNKNSLVVICSTNVYLLFVDTLLDSQRSQPPKWDTKWMVIIEARIVSVIPFTWTGKANNFVYLGKTLKNAHQYFQRRAYHQLISKLPPFKNCTLCFHT